MRRDLRQAIGEGEQCDIYFQMCCIVTLSEAQSEFSDLVCCCYILVAHRWLAVPPNASGCGQTAMLIIIRMPASSDSLNILKIFFLNPWENEHISEYESKASSPSKCESRMIYKL